MAFFYFGSTQLGYRVGWAIAATINVVLSVGSYLLLANSLAFSWDLITVSLISLLISAVGSAALGMYRLVIRAIDRSG